MEHLKLVAQSLGLELESPVEKILEAIKGLSKQATDGAVWEKEAHDNLNKVEHTEKAFRRIAELEAELFMKEAVANFQIDAAEATVLKEMYLGSEGGKASVEKLLETRAKRDYFTRKSSLTGREIPTDPMAELASRKAETKAKFPDLSDAECVQKVYKDDPSLFQRVTQARREKSGMKEGVS